MKNDLGSRFRQNRRLQFPLSAPAGRPGWLTYVGLAVAVGGPGLVSAVSTWIAGDSGGLGIQLLLQLLFCGLAVAVVAIVLTGERLPLSSIGLRRPDWSTLTTAALLFLVGFFVLPIITTPLVETWGRDGAAAGIAELAAFPAWFRVVLAVTSGIVEETLYRGYAVERLSTIVGRRWLGATLATLAFALAHIPMWGLGFSLAADLPTGIVLVLFYLWRRDLVANMLAHSAGILVAMFTVVPPVA